MSWKPPPGHESNLCFVEALREFLGLEPLYATEPLPYHPHVYTFPEEGRQPVPGGVMRTKPRFRRPGV